MPDISMCWGWDCEVKELCYRFRAIPDLWQSYFAEKPKCNIVKLKKNYTVHDVFPIQENPGKTIVVCKNFWELKQNERTMLSYADALKQSRKVLGAKITPSKVHKIRTTLTLGSRLFRCPDTRN